MRFLSNIFTVNIGLYQVCEFYRDMFVNNNPKKGQKGFFNFSHFNGKSFVIA